MNLKRSKSVLCLVALAVAFSAQVSLAATGYQLFKITNNDTTSASDLHITFTGGDLGATLSILYNAPGCTAPGIVKTTVPPNTVIWDITWASACVDSGDSITVRIKNNTTDFAFASGNWTPSGDTLGSSDVIEITDIPTLSMWGLMLLALVLIAAGVLVVRRKRTLQGA